MLPSSSLESCVIPEQKLLKRLVALYHARAEEENPVPIRERMPGLEKALAASMQSPACHYAN